MALSDVRAVTDQIQLIETTLSAIGDKRALLENYRTQRQSFADLVAQVQSDLDALMTASQAQLMVLRDKLNVAYPPGP